MLPLPRKPGPRLCGGTAPRAAYDAPGPDNPSRVASADAAIPGCGDVVAARMIPATQPLADGERPLFARGGEVVVCPHCDMATLPLDLLQAPMPLEQNAPEREPEEPDDEGTGSE